LFTSFAQVLDCYAPEHNTKDTLQQLLVHDRFYNECSHLVISLGFGMGTSFVKTVMNSLSIHSF